MAEETINDETVVNGAANAASMPQLRVLAQYIKDFSFENPNAPASLREVAQPKTDLQLDVSARGMEDASVFEVELKISAKRENEEQTMFIVELVYAGLFQFANVTQETIEPMLLIECPRILFPFARQILADATQNGGYPPMMLDPMDFAALYFSQRQGQAQQADA